MKLHITSQGEIASQLPTNLDIKRIKLARNFNPSVKDKKEVYRLEIGEIGEKKVLDYFEKYGLKHWIGMKNIWLEHYGTSEIDFTLLTSHCQYLIEIKNYNGFYNYKDGVSTVNNHVISSNPIDQTRRATIKMQSIMKERFRNIQVKGVLIFVGENSQISIQSEINDITILRLDELYDFIQKIIVEEQAHSYQSMNIQSAINHIEKYEVANPYPVQPITKAEMKALRKGIYCAYCGSFDLKIKKKYMICGCGLHEPRDEAFIRTICEYGALNFKNHLYTGELTKFLNGQASKSHIQKILSKYFEMVKNYRYTYYINKLLIYSKIHTLFMTKLPTYFIVKRGVQLKIRGT